MLRGDRLGSFLRARFTRTRRANFFSHSQPEWESLTDFLTNQKRAFAPGASRWPLERRLTQTLHNNRGERTLIFAAIRQFDRRDSGRPTRYGPFVGQEIETQSVQLQEARGGWQRLLASKTFWILDPGSTRHAQTGRDILCSLPHFLTPLFHPPRARDGSFNSHFLTRLQSWRPIGRKSIKPPK